MEPNVQRVEANLNGFDALAYDPSGDRIAAVSSKGLDLKLISGERLTAPAIRALPKTLVPGKGRLSVAFDGSGQLLLRREGAGAIQRAGIAKGVARRAPIRSRTVANSDGFVTSDSGTVISLVNGRVTELAANGAPLPAKRDVRDGEGKRPPRLDHPRRRRPPARDAELRR